MRIAKHPTLNIFAREDGAVLLPPCKNCDVVKYWKPLPSALEVK